MSPYWSNAREEPDFLLEMLPSNLEKSMFVFLIMLHKRKRQLEQKAWLCAQELSWKHLSTSLSAVLRIYHERALGYSSTLIVEAA